MRRCTYAALVVLILVPSVMFFVAYQTTEIPRPADMQANQVAMIYDKNRGVLSKIVPPEGNRTEVGIGQIPKHVRDAVISAEDRDFYTNPGFSVGGFARAARDNLMGKDTAGGGSTITQQYVKNAMLTSDRTLARKMRELVISAKMAREWNKDEILGAYLNTIYFGRGAYGIAAAAKAYYDKPVEKLTVEEGAMLAATIQQPSNLDPLQNPEGAQSRWGYVLDGMVTGKYLDQAQRAAMKYPVVIPARQAADDAQDKGPEGLIKKQVLRELRAAGINEQQLNTEGLQITTTIDPKVQKATLDAVAKNMKGERPETRTAAVSIDPRTGAVRGYYGGDNGRGYDFANAGVPTGSTFKVFGLAANLERGKPLSALYDSSSPYQVGGVKVTNVGGESCGMCTIAEALKRSLNTSFYRMEMEMTNGPQKIADIAHRLGIPDEIPGVGKTLKEPGGGPPNNGIILGQYQSRVLDMASAYATLAASGTFREPYFVQKVVTAKNEVLLDRGARPGEQRVDAAVADNVTDAMRPIAGYSKNHGLGGGSRPSAAKTGTAQLGDTGQNQNAWMVGYTPSLSTAVWVGALEGKAVKKANGSIMYGSDLPADIWRDTMDAALKGTPVEKFPKPAAIGGQAGVPQYSTPAPPSTQTSAPPSSGPAAPSWPFPFPFPPTGPGPQQPSATTTPSTKPEPTPSESTAEEEPENVVPGRSW